MNMLKFILFGTAAALTPLTLLAAPTVYIPLGSANEILIVDGATDKVTGTIKGIKNIHGLSLTPNGEYLIAGSKIEIIANNSMVTGHGTPSSKKDKPKPTPAVMTKPAGISAAEHKKHHPSQSGSLLPPVGISTISLIRVSDNTVETNIQVRGMAHHTFVTPNGKYAVSTHTTTGAISLIDLASKKIVNNIYTGPQPNYVVFAKNGKQMYVSNSGNNTLSVIDTKNWIVSRNILLDEGPGHMVISPDEKFIYTSNTRGGTISKVSLDKLKVVKTYTIGNNPHGIDISTDGATLYASTKKDNKLIAINIKSGKIRSLQLAPAPYHVTVVGDTGKLYVSSRKKPFIWVIDAKQLKVSGKIKVRGEGHQLVVAL